MIRRFCGQDAPALDALFALCHPTWPAKPEGWWWAYPTLVLEVNRRVVGCTAFAVSPPPAPNLTQLLDPGRTEMGWGKGVYVDPEVRGLGFGLRLAQARHAALKALDVGFFIGVTQPDNRAMCAIFEHQGLLRGAIIPKVYPDGQAGVLYTGGIT
jgi:GNAT superfamily N-acetyltransferase